MVKNLSNRDLPKFVKYFYAQIIIFTWKLCDYGRLQQDGK